MARRPPRESGRRGESVVARQYFESSSGNRAGGPLAAPRGALRVDVGGGGVVAGPATPTSSPGSPGAASPWSGSPGGSSPWSAATQDASDLQAQLHEEHARANFRLLVQVEQGPRILRFLALAGGVLSWVNAVVSIASHMNAISLLALYQVFFAAASMAFEAPTSWIQRFSAMGRFCDLLKNHASFLCDMGCRGAFYVFQGVLWLFLCWSLQVRGAHFVCGAYMVCVGALTIAAEALGYWRVVREVGEDAKLALGPAVDGKTFNTQELAEKRGISKEEQRPAEADDSRGDELELGARLLQ